MVLDINIDEVESSNLNFEYNYMRNSLDIVLKINFKDNIKRYFDNKLIEKAFNEKLNYEQNIELREFIKTINISKPVSDLWTDIEYVVIKGNKNLIPFYISQNKELITKKIVVEVNEYDQNLCGTLEKLIHNKAEIYFRCPRNTELIDFKTYKKTTEYINDKVNKIKEYNFSPLEAVMYLYDVVRDKEYCVESSKERKNVSRDLSKVLFGKNIVCEGYINIFNILLEKLGIKFFESTLTRKDSGKKQHIRSVVYLKDFKYDVEGIYFFDPTFDCRKSYKNTFLDEYKYFAKTKRYMNKYDHTRYVDEIGDIAMYGLFLEFASVHLQKDISKLDKNLIGLINCFSNLVYGHNIINDDTNEITTDIINKVRYISEISNRPLTDITLIDLFSNVRLYQNKENSLKYLYSPLSISKMLHNSNNHYENASHNQRKRTIKLK